MFVEAANSNIMAIMLSGYHPTILLVIWAQKTLLLFCIWKYHMTTCLVIIEHIITLLHINAKLRIIIDMYS